MKENYWGVTKKMEVFGKEIFKELWKTTVLRQYQCTECDMRGSTLMMHDIGKDFGICQECNKQWTERYD